MSWPVTAYADLINLHVSGRIATADSERQLRTANEVLRRLRHQPGLVLADEVGMGKTFVALAVAARVAWSDHQSRPVVVMVPPSLKDKWPRDFRVFEERCIRAGAPPLRARLASNAVEFFRLLDDPPPKRSRIIFLSHGALHHGLRDSWVRLAILKRALASPTLTEQRRVFPRFAASLLQVKSRASEDMMRALMLAPSVRWRDIMIQYKRDPGDDPIPEAIERVLRKEGLAFARLRDELRQLPLRAGENIEQRLNTLRRSLVDAMQEIWVQALKQAKFRSPLLILDEAHHAKNPETQLASLFVDPEAETDGRLLDGALARRFERMLFLTATPFQLGHRELVHVLDRFRDVAWSHTNIDSSREQFIAQLGTLQERLDTAQRDAADLDQKWRHVKPEDVGGDRDDSAALEAWWARALAAPEQLPERLQIVLRAYEATRRSMQAASEALAPLVIRHLRPRTMGASRTLRRALLPGETIVDASATGTRGLPIQDHSVLPFLLATRCQTIVSRLGEGSNAVSGRITFAEGLASSYEAFRETRSLAARRGERAIEDELGPREAAMLDLESHADGMKRRLDWYFAQLDGALPSDAEYASHPKIAPTRDKTLELWRAGEKVLIFCHFRHTGRALRRHISAELDAWVRAQAAAQLRCTPVEAERQLVALGERFEVDRPFHEQLLAEVEGLLPASLDVGLRKRVFAVVLRFVRTPSFLVRHFPLGRAEKRALLEQALEKQDGSGLSLRAKIRAFAAFIGERCEPNEREEYLNALESITTGAGRGGARGAGERYELQPNVRLANGEGDAADRRNLMLAFNTPFFPEILIASSVLAEGVDLHLDCRHIIHHDLCWNPSTLEQRTGRVDRIGAKAEKVEQPIHVYLPFVAGTQDEKMYRVVRDRERWFQVLMGEDYQVDDATTDRLAERVPLPEAAAKGLALKLEVPTR